MTDIWGFLLQTLTASGAAAVLLVVKYLFRDKLSPRWQFGVWGVLGLVLLLPAGWGGRYALFNWPLWLETAKTALTGDYSLTRVLSPFPLGLRVPEGPADVLFDLYVLGVLFLLGRYALSYLRLRLALRRGSPADPAQVERVAAQYGLKPCRAVEVPGLPSAFVCGVLRPVLALPAGTAVDDKVLLHELLHLKYRDAAWGLVLCLFRCLHWCDPLLWYCADRAGNDAEALCDQRVLERLEGEDRRDYGRILLSMAGGKYARAPGTSSMANGARNIRARVQAIARFKRYPAGMALVSVCVGVVLALGCAVGTRPAASVGPLLEDLPRSMAQVRLRRCSTPAGALDTFAKSYFTDNGVYLAMVRPLEEHTGLARRMEGAEYFHLGLSQKLAEAGFPWTDHYGDLDLERPLRQYHATWSVYNFLPDGAGGYTGLLCLEAQAGYGDDPVGYFTQEVSVTREDGGWIVTPLEELTYHRFRETGSRFPELEMPATRYVGGDGDYRVELDYQYILGVKNYVVSQPQTFFGGGASAMDFYPCPDVPFTSWDYGDGAVVWEHGVSIPCNLQYAAMTQRQLERGAVEEALEHCDGRVDAPSDHLRGGGGGSYYGGADWQSAPPAMAATFMADGGWHTYVLYPVEGGPA